MGCGGGGGGVGVNGPPISWTKHMGDRAHPCLFAVFNFPCFEKPGLRERERERERERGRFNAESRI